MIEEGINIRNEILIVIPCFGISKAQQEKIKKLYDSRAGVPVTVKIVEDTTEEGWPKIHNREFANNAFDWYVYTSQDYFPGKHFLQIALNTAKSLNKKHVGFNDGKWLGLNATAGVVHKSIVEYIPYKTLFFDGYFMHGADPELTDITKELDLFCYEPLAICIEIDYDKDFLKLRYPNDFKLYHERKTVNFNLESKQNMNKTKYEKECVQKLKEIDILFKNKEITELEHKIKKVYYNDIQQYGVMELYQDYPDLLQGQRNTKKRFEMYKLKEILTTDMTVLDVGSNLGFFSLYVAPYVKHITGVESGAVFNVIANILKDYLKVNNATFITNDFKKYNDHKRYDLVMSLAVHQWIGCDLDQYFKLLDKKIKPNGLLLLESHVLSRYGGVEPKFEKLKQIFTSNNYEMVSINDRGNDYVTGRDFAFFKKMVFKNYL